MPAVDHLPAAYIDTDMRYRHTCIIGSGKEDQVSRLDIRLLYRCTDIIKPLGSQPSGIPYP